MYNSYEKTNFKNSFYQSFFSFVKERTAILVEGNDYRSQSLRYVPPKAAISLKA